jgi:hypothetical protein
MSTLRALPVHAMFGQSRFSRFINSRTGRAFRLVAGVMFLGIGYEYRDHAAGVAAMVWSVLPLSAGALDLCYISALLGGPVSGAKIRGAWSAAGSTRTRTSSTPPTLPAAGGR